MKHYDIPMTILRILNMATEEVLDESIFSPHVRGSFNMTPFILVRKSTVKDLVRVYLFKFPIQQIT